MLNFLIVPIDIEALHISSSSGYLSVEAMANFRNLPYLDRDYNPTTGDQQKAIGQDVNAGAPYISENIVSPPFQNRNLHLAPGLHLYWSLPKALKTGKQIEQGLIFPTVPNRWLIRCLSAGKSDRLWIVESDYLAPPDQINTQNSDSQGVCIPYPAQPEQGIYQPFRYLGRQLDFSDWCNDQGSHKYWGEKLTAIGYGEPSFLAFYPNCHSVFGCHDKHYDSEDSDLSYEILGWHSHGKFDYVRSLIEANKKASLSLTELLQLLQEAAQWQIKGDQPDEPSPLKTLYYGCLKFQPDEDSSNRPTSQVDDTVVLANSGTEALSAYLADRESPTDLQEKHQLENQLEALQLLSVMKKERFDLDQALAEARHEKGFVAQNSGLIWRIESIESNEENSPEYAIGQQQQGTPPPLNLPLPLAQDLQQLNCLQEQQNHTQHQINSRRQQLFADWYKYLICLHPPIDHLNHYPRPELVRAFLLEHEISELDPKLISLQNEAINAQRDQIQTQLTAFNLELKQAATQSPKLRQYELKSVPAPRYWQPNDPVVMVVSPTKKSSSSSRTPASADPYLTCFLHSDPDQNDCENDYGKLFNRSLLDQLAQAIQTSTQLTDHDRDRFTSIWRSQPWQPFLLEWEVEVTSLRSDRTYAQDFIERHYEDLNGAIEFQPRYPDLSNSSVPQKDVYNGRSFLSSYASDQHKQQISAFFAQLSDVQLFCKDEGIELTPGWLDAHCQRLKDWLKATPSPSSQYAQRQRPLHLLDIYQSLDQIDCLSQVLNGFNQALLGRKQTLQLGVDDPIGFEVDQEFVEIMRQAIQDSIISAPQPLSYFNPIRSGTLKILRLRLVDTFGQVRDVNWTNTVTPEHLKAMQGNAVSLPPRIVQPARINFRWLSGKDDREEAITHQETNPICGWLLPNRLDKTLEIYNADGQSLGELEIAKVGDERWRSAPASAFAVESIDEIDNPNLERVVAYLNESNDPFLEEFMQSAMAAWDQIDPDMADSNPSQALIMGQPIAVVRASLNLQLQGQPAINQDWNIFKQELEQFRRNTFRQNTLGERETNGFTTVRFPFYLGNHRNLSDGLIAYWPETQQGNKIVLSSSVYIPLDRGKNSTVNYLDPKTKIVLKQIVRTHEPFYQTLESPPQFITALVDPRANVQVVSGILPTKSIQIPPEYYVDILNKLSITFMVAPILSPGLVSIPLADAVDCSWSWIEPTGPKQWREILPIGKIDRDTFVTHFDQLPLTGLGDRIWDYLLQAKVGWLRSQDNPTKAIVVTPVDRRSRGLAPPYDALQDSIHALLQRFVSEEIDRNQFISIFDETRFVGLGDRVWSHLLEAEIGWVKPLTDEVEYLVVPQAERRSAKLRPPYDDFQAPIELLLASLADQVRPTLTDATFAPQTIREGWLKLQHLVPT